MAKAPDCTPNVNVIFSDQPQAQVDDIYRRRDLLLGFRFHSQVKKGDDIQAADPGLVPDPHPRHHGESFLEVENAVTSPFAETTDRSRRQPPVATGSAPRWCTA